MTATKKTKDLVKGDKIHVEFGDNGNWVSVELTEDVRQVDSGAWEIKGKHIGSGREVTMYSMSAEEETEIIE